MVTHDSLIVIPSGGDCISRRVQGNFLFRSPRRRVQLWEWPEVGDSRTPAECAGRRAIWVDADGATDSRLSSTFGGEENEERHILGLQVAPQKV